MGGVSKLPKPIPAPSPSLEPYLLRCLVIRNVSLDPQGPLYVQEVLIELQQEHDQHKDSIHHEESKNRLVSQFFKVGRDPSLESHAANVHLHCTKKWGPFAPKQRRRRPTSTRLEDENFFEQRCTWGARYTRAGIGSRIYFFSFSCYRKFVVCQVPP